MVRTAGSTWRRVLDCYWWICLVGIVAVVSYFAVANNGSTALFAVFPCCMVVMLTFPWLSRLESDRQARRHILWITVALLISGTIWFPAWWGLGFVAVPAITAALFGYAFAARAAVLQASQPFDFGDEVGIGDEDP